MPESSVIDHLTEGEAAAELERLADAMAEAERLYFREDAPTLTDAEYDALKRRNLAIEARFPDLVRPDSPSRRVGAPPSEQFSPVEYKAPMLSLDNAFSDEDVTSFVAGIRRFLRLESGEPIAFTAEPKIDGLSANLRYEKGILVQGSTRGDGRTGEDITANLRTIGDIPERLLGSGWPDVIDVRGEVYMETAAFALMNAEADAKGERTYVNPRNSAAGSLRQIDASITARRPLRFFAYAWGHVSAPFAQTQSEVLELFSNWGFRTNPLSRRVENADGLATVYAEFAAIRGGLDYEIDGVVFKIDRLDWQDRLGSVGRIPQWAIAHKFPPEQEKTILEGIDIQVGRTGALTPVARLKPVFVGGVTVSNVTLHNAAEIARKDVRIGDTVIVQRAGDVIPQIASVVVDAAHNARSLYDFPTLCPCPLHTEVVRETTATGADTVVRRCTGELSCPFQKIEHLKHFVSRRAFDIEGLGEKQLIAFHEDGLINEPADIFTLEERDKTSLKKLKDRERAGDLSTKNLFESINNRRNVSLDRFIYGLGVRHVGETTALTLAKFFNTIENFISTAVAADKERPGPAYKMLASVPHVGDVRVAELLALPFKAPIFSDLILNTSELGTVGTSKPVPRNVVAELSKLHPRAVDLKNFLLAAYREKPGGSYMEFLHLPDVGVAVADSICDFFGTEATCNIVLRLLEVVKPAPVKQIVGGKLAGLTIVFTGTLDRMSRGEAKAQAERLGAKVASSVSHKTDIVVAGPGAGSKLKLAAELGLQVMNEDQWLAFIA